MTERKLGPCTLEGTFVRLEPLRKAHAEALLEADELSDRVCIIDHGKIMAVDTPQALKDRYNTNSLLEVFLELTGRELRDSANERISMRAPMGRM